ncbi:MAG: hypothetical protein CML46_21715 [Rhodobacteraceae bacterium]|nr:hypothetical protein [Paracoccaceae bacterium]
MKLTLTQQRALADLAKYTDAPEAIEAALRLNAYSTRLDADQLQQDIRTIMIHTALAGSSIHEAYLPLLEFAWMHGRRNNPVHAAAMIRACWGDWKSWLTYRRRHGDRPVTNANQRALEFARRMRPPQIESPAELMWNGEDGDEPDRDFFEALPEEFTVWRGVSDIDPDTAAKGMSFTTDERVARWFARHEGGAPVLIRATVRKSDVLTTFAYEHEVVVRPASYDVVPFNLGESRAYPAGSQWADGPAVIPAGDAMTH